MLKELDGKIGHLVIELQKKKRALEHEHTETEMVQVRDWWPQSSLRPALLIVILIAIRMISDVTL